ncbi:glycosyltransferase [Georgenia daeguensis]|uniref:D-inositol 3-phosphate glycosyltransferase n=1 Tax=Georgenia daeguensis TaxID=908355 RepID=A0ABP8EUL0_9MICO
MRVLRISHSAVVDAWRERERAVRRRGIDVRLLSARRWDGGGAQVPLGPRAGEDVAGVATLGRHPALFLYDPRPVWRALGEHWDVLDIHEEPFALATAEVLLLRALRRRRPPYLLYSAQNIDKRYPLPFRLLERRALTGASAVSVCNSAAGAIVRRKGFPGTADIVPLGVDTAAFAVGHDDGPADAPGGDGPAEAPGEDGPDDGGAAPRVRAGYVGRLAPHKGVDVLLDAVAGDPRLTLTIAGSGPDAGRVRDRIATLGLADRVVMAGHVPHERLPDLYRGLDILAVPSLTTPSWLEQFGRVAVEAMASGVPVVASDSGALPDVVGGAGLLVPPGDPAALRAALVRVGEDAALAGRMRAAGLRRARECDWEAVADRYAAMYRRVARRHDGGRPEHGPEIVVVAFGAPELLARALAPLAGLPVTVVDNSSDPRVAAVTAEAGARYVDPGRNGGFAAGVNAALSDRLVPGGDVLLLNPDAVVTPEAVARLHRHLLADPRLGSVAPAQVDAAGRRARVAWPFPSPAGTWAEAVGLGRLRRRPGFVVGSVLLLRAEALEQVGAFDERFFLYAEETDWAYRASLLGWRHREVTAVTALHQGAGTSTDPGRREVHFHASQERYLRKHHGAAGWQLARAGQVLGAGARAVLLGGTARAGARDRLRLYLRGPVRVEASLGRPR